MSRIDIPAGELGTTRVFSLSMPADTARLLRDDAQRQMALLGVETLNTTGVEVFALSDLGDLGLAGYLREGADAQEDDLKRDRVKLAALEGWVMLVHSLAFGGMPVTLIPAAELTLIGTYAQTPPPNTQIGLEAEAAQPYSGTAGGKSAQAGRNQASAARVTALLAIVVIAVLWWALG